MIQEKSNWWVERIFFREGSVCEIRELKSVIFLILL